MSDFENLKLENQLCFSLYATTNAITRLYRQKLSSVDLTYTQYLVMLVLWENGEQTVKQIAQRLELDSPAVTPILKRLENEGFLNRQRSAVDERSVLISVSETGLAMKARVAQIQREVACRTGLPEDEFKALQLKLAQLLNNLTREDNASCSAA